MESQIYCLPQKFGWNSYPPNAGYKKSHENKPKVSTPYFTVNFDVSEVSTHVHEDMRNYYPKLAALTTSNTESLERAKTYAYMSTNTHDFQPIYIYPKRKEPIMLETSTKPLGPLRQYGAPSKTLHPPCPGPHNDPQRGFFPWRCLVTTPGDCIWKSPGRPDWQTRVGERSTLPPVRLSKHDATKEKERWDYIRNLAGKNAIGYKYRRELVGYTGHKMKFEHIVSKVERNVAHPNAAMESTTQATHKEFSADEYMSDDVVNRHQGPMSRMVTLTHPYNPYTQQSAYPNVGSAGTQ